MVICASQVRQSAIGLTAYQTENDGKYPYFRSLYPTHIVTDYSAGGGRRVHLEALVENLDAVHDFEHVHRVGIGVRGMTPRVADIDSRS